MRILLFLLLLTPFILYAAPTDPYSGTSATVQTSATNGFAITPSDSVDLTVLPKAISATTDGIIRCTLSGMTDGTFIDVPSSGYASIRCKRVWATGTTATGLVGLY